MPCLHLPGGKLEQNNIIVLKLISSKTDLPTTMFVEQPQLHRVSKDGLGRHGIWQTLNTGKGFLINILPQTKA